MLVDTPQRTNFLTRSHLFHGLDETQIGAVAAELTEETFAAGKEIIKQGDAGDRLYLIWKGKVKVTQTKRGKETVLANLVVNDYFGEESLLSRHHHRTATITAIEDVQVLVLTREQFRKLLKQAPTLKTNFAVTVSSHRLARQIQFKWLLPNEVVYYLARKNEFFLVKGITGPVTLFLVGVIAMFVSWLAYWPGYVWWVAFAVSAIAVLWGIWRGVDWSNDYYIVTNSRVVWLEKIVGIYDSRQESPLSAIQRINVETILSGRILDYGDLIVRTIVGTTLTLKNVDHPYQAAALIEEHWKRSQESSRRMEESEMREALKVRLLQGTSKPITVGGIVAKPPPKHDPYKSLKSRRTLFSVRFEDKAVVTYRKHIVVLVEQVWKQTVLIFILLAVPLYELLTNNKFSFVKIFGSLGTGTLLGIWFILLVAAIVWWIYEYVDWSNDIFQVTADQIMDIDKTPLGQVTSDIAALDNVLSIEYEQRGLTQLLFNYGTVFITIGGGKRMAFEDVFNPSSVQQDIERRRLDRISKKEADKIKAERERMVDWFAAYYHGEQAIRQEDKPAGADGQTPLPAAPSGGEPPKNN
jgi:CRP-like cAMP-binding protein